MCELHVQYPSNGGIFCNIDHVFMEKSNNRICSNALYSVRSLNFIKGLWMPVSELIVKRADS